MKTEKTENTINIALMTSNESSNVEKIIQYFEPFLDANISCVISNKEDILKNIRRYKVPIYTTKWYKEIDKILTENNIHYIVLTDYTDKIPKNFSNKYKWKIINIHTSLLPKYVDLYGDDIFQNIKKHEDEKTGISIYLDGTNNMLFQKEIKIDKNETWQEIKSRVQILEHKFYPIIIEKFIKGTYKNLYEK